MSLHLYTLRCDHHNKASNHLSLYYYYIIDHSIKFLIHWDRYIIRMLTNLASAGNTDSYRQREQCNTVRGIPVNDILARWLEHGANQGWNLIPTVFLK